jgi:hypothetical protein
MLGSRNAKPGNVGAEDGITNTTPQVHRRFGKIRAAPGVRKRIQERPPRGHPGRRYRSLITAAETRTLLGRTSEVPPRSPRTTQRPLIAVCLAHQAARCNGTTTFTVYSW